MKSGNEGSGDLVFLDALPVMRQSELPVSELLNCYASTSEEIDDGPRRNSWHSSWMPFPPSSAPSKW